MQPTPSSPEADQPTTTDPASPAVEAAPESHVSMTPLPTLDIPAKSPGVVVGGSFDGATTGSPAALPTLPTTAPTTPDPATFFASDSAATPGAPVPAPKSKKRGTMVLAILAGVLLIGGGSAAAYFGVVVPNKPDNILKAAIVNALQQKQVTASGSFTTDPTASDGGIAAKINFKSQFDTSSKSAAAQINATYSGVSLDIETRYLDQNLYVKAGDLSPLTGLAATFAPEVAPVAQTISKQLSNQWILIDSTLIRQAGGSCVVDASWSLTTADQKILTDQYGKNPFTVIQSSSSDTVGGKKATKLVLSIDDDKLAKYVTGLKDLSLVKSLKSCMTDKTSKTSIDGSSLADHDHTPITIWVDKGSKQIVKIASHSTAQDEKKNHIKDTISIDLSYGKVSITKPSGAKPVIQVITDLQTTLKGTDFDLSSLISGISNSSDH